MSKIGIIAEFNPLHNGHKFLIEQAKKGGNTVVCVISSNFVQRGDTSLISKYKRAECALSCGADLVLELPVSWSMSTAQNFALGGVSILNSIGCDTLMFGSECGEVSELERAADILISNEFSFCLASELKKGITFAAARENAAEICGVKDGILSGANNNLAIEYIIAAKAIGSGIKFRTITREGASHDSEKTENDFCSASLLRKKILSGDYAFAARFMPKEALSVFKKEDISDIKNIENAILAVLRSKTLGELKNLPDISEGIENKLYSAIRVATGLDELYNTIKVKRYTHARVRRLVLSAFLGIDNSYFMKIPPYIRVLGFNSYGEEMLKSSVRSSNIPVILRAAELKLLTGGAKTVFETECRAADLYSLSLFKPLACGEEYTTKLLKVTSASLPLE